jgi:glycine oxidase
LNPSCHITVFGAGIFGVWTALELLRRGARVTLLEAEQPGVRATGASAGMLAPQYEAGSPGDAFLLGVRARREYAAFVARVERLAEWPVGYRTHGMLVANRTEAEEQQAREALRWQGDLGLRGEILSGAAAAELHPGISREIPTWQWLPDEAQVDAQRLAVALGPAAQRAGAQLRLGEQVTKVLSQGGRVTGVRTAIGDVFSANAIVLAAGAWSPSVSGVRAPGAGADPAAAPGFHPGVAARGHARRPVPRAARKRHGARRQHDGGCGLR